MIKDTTLHQRIVFARFSEAQIYNLLIKEACQIAIIDIDDKTEIKTFISTKNRTGTAGIEYYAEITITNNL